MSTITEELPIKQGRDSNPNNQRLLASRLTNFERFSGPRVGDYLKMPHGEYTRFTYDLGDQIQTGGRERSRFYMTTGGQCDFSGTLHSGVLKADLQLTDERKDGLIWFFDQNYQRADGGVEFMVPFRVFTLIDGADTSGLPQIVAHERKTRADKAEKIQKYDPYRRMYVELPLPVLYFDREAFQKSGVEESALRAVLNERGLYLDGTGFYYMIQPYTQDDITAIQEVTGYSFGAYSMHKDSFGPPCPNAQELVPADQ